MGTALVICLVLVTHLHAKSIAPSSNITSTTSTSTTAPLVISTSVIADATTPSSTFDIEDELAKIAAICLTHREDELLSGDLLKYGAARLLNIWLAREAIEIIGLAQLRAVLGFAPSGPWTHYREPSKEEIAAAPTVEAYYELREPHRKSRSLSNPMFHEKNFPPAIEFLDKRIPAIRAIYRRKFEELRSRPDAKETIDRKEVDRMIDGHYDVYFRVHHAIMTMFDNYECDRDDI